MDLTEDDYTGRALDCTRQAEEVHVKCKCNRKMTKPKTHNAKHRMYFFEERGRGQSKMTCVSKVCLGTFSIQCSPPPL